MRIAIVVSTQVRDPIEKIRLNLSLLSDAFPTAKIIAGIWSYEKEKVDDIKSLVDDVVLIDEPVIHYDPYIDNPNAVSDWNYQKKLKNPNERHKHQTKQLLVHNELMKRFQNNFDVIVRARWDTTIGIDLNFMQFAHECMDIPATIAISTRRDYHKSILTIGEVSSWEYPFLKHECDRTNKIVTSATCEMLLDNGIIIHRVSDWSCELVDRLHNNSRLLAAEFGWYQILVEGTSHHKWKHYDGGATITRTVIKSDRDILKKYESICNYN